MRCFLRAHSVFVKDAYVWLLEIRLWVSNCTAETFGTACQCGTPASAHIHSQSHSYRFWEMSPYEGQSKDDECAPSRSDPAKEGEPRAQLYLIWCWRCLWFSCMIPSVSLSERKRVTLQEAASSVQMKSQGCLQVLGPDEVGDFRRAFQVKGIFQKTYVAGSFQMVPLPKNTNRERKRWGQKIYRPQVAIGINILKQKII